MPENFEGSHSQKFRTAESLHRRPPNPPRPPNIRRVESSIPSPTEQGVPIPRIVLLDRENQQLKAENTTVVGENQVLQDANTKLKEINIALKKEKAEAILQADNALRIENQQLKQDVQNLESRIAALEGQLNASSNVVTLLRGENQRLDAENINLRGDITRLQRTVEELKAQAARGGTRRSETGGGPRDSKGYYRILGIDPDDAVSLSPEKFEKMLRSIWRAKSHAFHPDTEGGDNVKQTAINQAYEFLKDPNKRRGYR